MAAKLRGPGLYRAGIAFLLGIVFATGLTWLVRMSTGHTTFHHYLSGDAILTVSLLGPPRGSSMSTRYWEK